MPAGHRIRAPCMPRKWTPPICAATCQNGFPGVDHGVRAIALRSGLLPETTIFQFAPPLVRQRHSGRFDGAPRCDRRRRGCNAARRQRHPRQNTASATDCAQDATFTMIPRPAMMLPGISDLLNVREGSCATQRRLHAAFDRSAAHRQAPGMALAYERPRKLEDERFRKRVGTQCDRSNAVINAGKTILACCGANAAFGGVHFLGMHGARIRWPAGDPSKWSSTHGRLARP